MSNGCFAILIGIFCGGGNSCYFRCRLYYIQRHKEAKSFKKLHFYGQISSNKYISWILLTGSNNQFQNYEFWFYWYLVTIHIFYLVKKEYIQQINKQSVENLVNSFVDSELVLGTVEPSCMIIKYDFINVLTLLCRRSGRRA